MLVAAEIRPRNTRISKELDSTGSRVVFNILQASVAKNTTEELLGHLQNGAAVITTKGDHSVELEKIRLHLCEASKATDSKLRIEFLDYYRKFSQTGDAVLFNNSQRLWMKDKQPRVETFFGFNHKYRDPAGARAEFQGCVAILDAEGSKELNFLQRDAQTYIATLPWVKDLQGTGGINGPFELDTFQAPDFNAIYGKRKSGLIFFSVDTLGVAKLTVKSTILLRNQYIHWSQHVGGRSQQPFRCKTFLANNVSQFCDNWKDYAWKNIMVKNRDQATRAGELSQGEPAWFITESERTTYLPHIDHSITFKIALHELFGHGTGKLLSEPSPREYNFDITNPPINPLMGLPIATWYRQGERTSSIFGEMDMSIEECRAEAIAAYLAFDEGIQATKGYTDTSDITAQDYESTAKITSLRN